MQTKSLFWSMILIIFLTLTGCGLLPPFSPTDLKFYSVSLVGTNTLSLPKQKDISSYNINPMPRKVLEVRFISNIDLIKERKGWRDTYLVSVACRYWKDVGRMIRHSSGGYIPTGPIGMNTSDIYWNEIDVFRTFEKEISSDTAPFVYHFYIDVSRKGDQEGYDLSNSAEDVCFWVKSAEMLRIGVRTNVVTIPKEAITEALRCEQSSIFANTPK